MRITILFALAAMLASPAAARNFAIGGETIAESEIVDARAQPQLGSKPTVLVTLSEAAAKRVQSISQARAGMPLPITLDGKSLGEPVLSDPSAVNPISFAGGNSMAEAEALARTISGKAPVPDELDEP